MFLAYSMSTRSFPFIVTSFTLPEGQSANKRHPVGVTLEGSRDRYTGITLKGSQDLANVQNGYDYVIFSLISVCIKLNVIVYVTTGRV